jgi:hypothetical protein
MDLLSKMRVTALLAGLAFAAVFLVQPLPAAALPMSCPGQSHSPEVPSCCIAPHHLAPLPQTAAGAQSAPAVVGRCHQPHIRETTCALWPVHQLIHPADSPPLGVLRV